MSGNSRVITRDEAHKIISRVISAEDTIAGVVTSVEYLLATLKQLGVPRGDCDEVITIAFARMISLSQR